MTLSSIPVSGSVPTGGYDLAVGPGDEAFALALGDLQIIIRSRDTEWITQAAQRYGSFVLPLDDPPATPTFCLDYQVLSQDIPSPEVLCRARRQGLRAHRHGSRVTVQGDGFEGQWFLDEGRLQMSGPRATYPLDLVAQALWYAEQPSALIVHAAAFREGPWAWLCAGPSGSGKSTLASLFPDRALSDELVGVLVGGDERDATGKGTEVVALPFWSGCPGRFPLAAVHCLRHRGHLEEADVESGNGTHLPEAHIRRLLEPRLALRALRGQISWPTWDAAAMTRCLEALGRLIETVDVYELAFSPRADVWPHLAVGCRESCFQESFSRESVR